MNTIQMVPIDRIDPHPKNPRRDLGDLRELAGSIKAQGLQQNLVLVPHEVINGALREDRYRLVIGHRRKAAAELAGLTEVPAVVNSSLTDAQQLELMLLENVQRQDLTPIEEAEGYQELLDLDVSVAAIAKATGRKVKTVRDRMKLLDLPEVARERIHSGQGSLLDAGKLEEFADDPGLQAELGALIGTNNFAQQLTSARETRKRRAAQQPIVDALLAKGLTEEVDHAQTGSRSWIGHCSEVGSVEALMVPEGSVFVRSNWRTEVELYGPPRAPLSDEEQEAAAAQRERQEAEWAAERAQREADQAEAEECWQTRDAWIRERITGRFTHQHGAMLAEHVAPILLTQGSLSSYSIGSWLGIDYSKSEKARQKAIAGFMDGLDWAAYLLVFLHLLAGHSWSGRALPVLYEVLEQLGYQVSDVERSRITPPAEDSDEDVA